MTTATQTQPQIVTDIMAELETLGGFEQWLEKLSMYPSIEFRHFNPLVRYIRCKYFLNYYAGDYPFRLGVTQVVFEDPDHCLKTIATHETPELAEQFLERMYGHPGGLYVKPKDALKIIHDIKAEAAKIQASQEDEF